MGASSSGWHRPLQPSGGPVCKGAGDDDSHGVWAAGTCGGQGCYDSTEDDDCLGIPDPADPAYWWYTPLGHAMHGGSVDYDLRISTDPMCKWPGQGGSSPICPDDTSGDYQDWPVSEADRSRSINRWVPRGRAARRDVFQWTRRSQMLIRVTERPHHAGRWLLATTVATTLALVGQLLAVAPAWAATPTCDGLAATIVGTPGDDTLIGTPGDDVIVGKGGDDVIRGAAGDDFVCGGDGRDRLHGGSGQDRITGGPGADAIWGGQGDDLLGADAGDDRIDGGPGRDRIDYSDAPRGITLDLRASAATGWGRDALVSVENALGSGFADVLLGDGGANFLYSESGADVIRGRGGDDQLISYGDDVRIDGGSGDDWISGTQGDAYLVGGKGDDELKGGRGNDVLLGGPGDDLLTGRAGDDRLSGGTGDDTLLGGSGSNSEDGGPGTDTCRGDSTPVRCEK